MHEPVEVLKVFCWGQYVGALALDQNTRYYAFEYNPDFQKLGIELAPLALPSLQSGPQIFTQLSTETYYRLPPFIADSLPDDYGNSLINAWMANRGISKATFSPLDRLAYVGSRGMGALEYVPALEIAGRSKKPTALEMNELVSEARRAVNVDLMKDSALDVESELAQLIQVGTSAGGARAKAVVGFNPQTNEFVSGQFGVPKGFEHWIIKFDVFSDKPGEFGDSQEYGRIEYAYYLMARDCGIAMETSRLYEAAGRTHFMTKRFDRGENNERHHVQTLCAMAQLDYNYLRVHDYAQLFQTAVSLGLPLEAHDELFRRMVFNVALSNKDDHTKNHAFRLKRGGTWELTPAYDITYAHGVTSDSWTIQHILGVGGVFIDISRKDVTALAGRFHVRNSEAILATVLDVADNWSEYAAKAGLATSEKDRIAQDIARCCAQLKA